MYSTIKILAALSALVPLATPALTASPAPHADTATERGSGRYPALFEARPDLPGHVVYRPERLDALGDEKLGIYVFGNGGCSADGTSSRNHLLEIASHGYLVIASGVIPAPATPLAAGRAPTPAPEAKLEAKTSTEALTQAIDWAIRENQRAQSPFKGRIAIDQIAASGWSCGGLQALSAAQDLRVQTVVVMNSGFFPEGANPIAGVVSDKRLLGTLHGSALYVLGGPTDIAFANGTDDFARLRHLPAALVNIPVGHGGTYRQPHGGVAAEVVTAWLDWQLKRRTQTRDRFVGPDCGYCSDRRLTLERKNF